MGRHRAEPVGKRRDHRTAEPRSGRSGHRRNPELLGWGLFLTGTSAACLFWAEVPVALVAGVTGLLLAAFLTAWYLSAGSTTAEGPGHRAGRSTPAPAAAEKPLQPSPVPGTGGKTAVTVPPIPLAPEAVQEFLGGGRAASAAAPGETSRWTRTFGPPETGSLPLQPYVPARRAAVQTADPQQQDRRQRSHSSH
ncbi:hypothetical protein H9639_03730 [Arthrobacter sp. Sa2CUA1]|uniref:Uncharacterized protein n=1 Tax=Arthrobacter gallicola TaxID=2762225 RepID=A0ABR8UPC7_9MICC|nr:hypothetical protein [Arthrobacter gallicola]MBD7994402.1 hypothetical protein [Arthrobacter gallicola]